jgi:type II secretory ATPase GspE/PulE/Tfp pilus assembly ATPase PilB-like protein
MRDLETASTGVEASLTGHLVMSTLHTNSAPETVTRLVDMGLDPFTFSDALLGVLAQRLARRLCMDCKTSYTPEADERAKILKLYGPEATQDGIDAGPMTLWRAVGCSSCRGGYKGRLAIHELLVATDPVKEAIQSKQPAGGIRDVAVAGGMRTLLQDGIMKSLDGHTDLGQILAVCSG